MTLYKRIKDYYDGRRSHYHLERIAPLSDEPTEDDLRGEDREAIEMFLGYEASLPKELTDKLRDKK